MRSATSLTVRSTLAGANTEVFPRRNPKTFQSQDVVPWAASLLCLIYRAGAWLRGWELESLRIGLCEENADDEALVSLFERSQMPRRWRSGDSLPIEWQCDELIARLVREGKNPLTRQAFDAV